jgi:hypothetical protein
MYLISYPLTSMLHAPKTGLRLAGGGAVRTFVERHNSLCLYCLSLANNGHGNSFAHNL